ncbi:MAG: Mur ligase family protein [Brevinema sp.]
MKISSINRVDEDIYPARVYRLLKEQGFDPDSLKYIHVTGSKGKGTIARTCLQLLCSCKKKVGLFTSPHIFNIIERIETQDGLISEIVLTNLFIGYQNFLKKHDLHFFEIILFLSIIYFIEQQCEYVILEVGVGGRFDPTNFCQPELVLISQISLEHREFLGGSLEQIASNKAGVIKKNTLVFSLPQEEIVKNILKTEAYLTNAQLIFLTLEEFSNVSINDQGYSVFEIDGCSITLLRFGYSHLMNFLLALKGISSLINLPCLLIQNVASEVIPYRIDRVHPNILIDTSHNGTSFFYLFDTLRSYLKWEQIVLFVTLLEGKEINDVVDQIKQNKDLIKKIVVFDFNHKRKSNGRTVYQLLKEDFEIEHTDYLPNYSFNWSEKNIFTGSFYSVAMVKGIVNDAHN